MKRKPVWYALKGPDGVLWHEISQTMAWTIERDGWKLDNPWDHTDTWEKAKKRGWRIVRVLVTPIRQRKRGRGKR